LTSVRDVPVAVRKAGTALVRNRLRAALTATGITIGTGAVIFTVAIGEGGSAQIHEQLLLLGGGRARDGEIRLQFLAEAIGLCLAGSALGVAAGMLASRGVAEAMGWPMLLSPLALAVAVGSAVVTGVIFGYYPALRASRLDPIEALRQE